MTESFQRVEALFLRALEYPAAERDAFVRGETPDQPEVRRQVERLLLADSQAGRFIEDVVESHARSLSGHDHDRIGQHVGPYRFVRLLGRGGMSSVYLAARSDDAFEKDVAIKLVESGMGSDDMLGRLLSERRILAGLEHSNIAEIYDAGTTEDGMPYFVMEYVDGLPIDQYCDQQGLGIGQRIELFRDVCSAVHYAHRGLVVHRDLKPSNVLVTAAGVTKLLDFGIAKLLDSDASGTGLVLSDLVRRSLGGNEPTAVGARPMTPSYASPEQVRGEPITTSSDVYSLGVLLFVLLTGRRPYPIEAGSPLMEIERVICNQPAATASLVVVEVDSVQDTGAQATGPQQTSEDLARLRGESPSTLGRRLRGDLDMIMAKALTKEPERRYGSVKHLSEDLERYLTSRPVKARPHTLGYRFSKLFRRHRLGTALALGALAVGIAFTIALALQSRRTALERDRAKQVSTMLMDLFQIAEPATARGSTINVLTLLDRGAEQVGQLDDQPELQAQFKDTLGQLYEKVGFYDKAEEQFAQSLNLRRQILGDRHLAVAESYQHLARSLARQGKFEAAGDLFRRALEQRRTLLGAEHPSVAESTNSLALVLHETGHYEEAEPLYRSALRIDQKWLGDDGAHTSIVRGNLALLLHDKGDYAEAERLFRLLLARVEQLGDEELVAESEDCLGLTMMAQGDLEGAGAALRRGLEIRQRLFGNSHPLVARSLDHVGMLLLEQGDLESAEPLLVRGLELRRKTWGDDNAEVADSLDHLATLHAAQGHVAAAERYFLEAAELYRQSFSAEHPWVGRPLVGLGKLLSTQSCQRGVPLLRQGLALLPPADFRVPAAQAALRSCG